MIVISRFWIGDDASVTLAMAMTGSIVAFFVSIPFSLVFDTVSDTIFYCNEVEQQLMQTVAGTRTATGGFVSRICPCIYRPAMGDSLDRRRGTLDEWKGLHRGQGQNGNGGGFARDVRNAGRDGGDLDVPLSGRKRGGDDRSFIGGYPSDSTTAGSGVSFGSYSSVPSKGSGKGRSKSALIY